VPVACRGTRDTPAAPDSDDLPVTAGARAASVGERRPDLYLAGFSPDLGRVLLATTHGGSGWDLGLALAAGIGPASPPADDRAHRNGGRGPTTRIDGMGKSLDRSKEAKKKPAKSAKEKRAEKEARRAARNG
jgi:hypothetical protein